MELISRSLGYFKKYEIPEQWGTGIVEIEEDAQSKGLDKFIVSDATTCTCFSDSIVVSVEVDKNNLNERFSTLVANLSKAGAILLCEGIFIRGGITIGEIVHESAGIVFGQGLIDAYELESAVAFYPRILVSTKLLSNLKYPLRQKRDRYPYHQYLERFEDGCVGFHQLIYFQVMQSVVPKDEELFKQKLKRAKTQIVKGLDANINKPEIFKKYFWMKKEYENLIILDDGIKEIIHDVSEGDCRSNIHFGYIDDIFFPD